METLKFKTNIKCGGCVDTISPFLNQDEAIKNWVVDLKSPDRVLQVETTHSAAEVTGILKKAGYTAQELN
ncbi:heavy-metal-associated domain-containing protein [Dyadobacter sandarakinus]|uniref:Copper chaperone CopZ n=1 Tax=Dyadobacter sandarakinus TaxID=2747268 RepID=A0ABX7I7K9_9BACT|nr:hypothetical protein [Dyadobacter sandarakinus]QRR02074.1 hypothetical protein HWI92_14740 [Dyadobacter sandarakinus]